MDSSDDEGAGEDQESIQKRSKLQSWFHFCDKKVAAIERTWNRKLENAGQEPAASSAGQEKDEAETDESHEQTIENMFANFDANKIFRAGNAGRSGSGRNAAAAQVKQTT